MKFLKNINIAVWERKNQETFRSIEKRLNILEKILIRKLDSSFLIEKLLKITIFQYNQFYHYNQCRKTKNVTFDRTSYIYDNQENISVYQLTLKTYNIENIKLCHWWERGERRNV